jgi:NTP pyrophosphatase (non-canonical NTP hydrolase)
MMPRTIPALDDLTLSAINAEFVRAYVKHSGHTPRDPRMSNGERLAILVEEVGEVARAMTYDEGSPEKLVRELIQVAAMAGAWAEYAESAR